MKMKADKGDRRTTHRVNTKRNIAQRAQYSLRRENGICFLCGKVPVKNRKICIGCSDKQMGANAVAGFRKVLERSGITDTTIALEVLGSAKTEANSEVISALMEAIKTSERKRKPKDITD